jgi:hypothetical protein
LNEDLEKLILEMNESKSTQGSDIPTKIIKENSKMFSKYLTSVFNDCIEKCIFPSNLKLSEITPIFKKGSKLKKDNYRPVSILPNISKLFEKLLHDQIYNYINRYLSDYQCGFRKGRNAQQSLLLLTEIWKEALDNRNVFGALLTDLSKAFDCISHDLLIAKLKAYKFNNNAIKLVFDYLSCRKHRTKINNSFSSWAEILYGVPQGSILGPLLFIIYISDMFLIIENVDFSSYADDNSPFVVGKNFEEVKHMLENISEKLFDWFNSNQLKSNAEKCHLITNLKDTELCINISNSVIKNSSKEKLLGIVFDNRLTFDDQLNGLYKNATRKFHALARISSYISLKQRKILFNSFFMSQFGYCPLIWIFGNRKQNNRINNLHLKGLRMVYQDKSSSFQELLRKDNSVCIHHRNIQFLAIELYKYLHDKSPSFYNRIFIRQPFTSITRSDNVLRSRKINSTFFGSESLSYLAPKIWELVPSEIKKSTTLDIFKTKIKKWIPNKCPCRICRVYIQGVGFID